MDDEWVWLVAVAVIGWIVLGQWRQFKNFDKDLL
jgi:hypothetical protein